jgi:hypothetical protein
MSNEIQVQVGLQIRKDGKLYQSQPTTFKADLIGNLGHSPGRVLATKAGVDIDLSKLVDPGLCWIQNLDTVNYVTVGRWDATTGKFYPVMKILPQEFYIIRLADDVTEEYEGTGTGTGSDTTTLRVKAANAPCYVEIEAFDS